MSDRIDLNGGGRSIAVAEVESAISRIPSVTAARVVTAPNGRIAEVHVLAKRDRAPKQLVRDVQSVALASFGLEVDYRTVSVVQLDDPAVEEERTGGGAPADVARVALVRTQAEVSGHSTEVRVFLQAGARELSGSARGPATNGMRLVARAVLDAVAPLAGDRSLDVEFAELIAAGPCSVAIAVLTSATARGDQVVSGSAVVRKDPNDAMARATLAALNRLIAA